LQGAAVALTGATVSRVDASFVLDEHAESASIALTQRVLNAHAVHDRLRFNMLVGAPSRAGRNLLAHTIIPDAAVV